MNENRLLLLLLLLFFSCSRRKKIQFISFEKLLFLNKNSRFRIPEKKVHHTHTHRINENPLEIVVIYGGELACVI